MKRSRPVRTRQTAANAQPPGDAADHRALWALASVIVLAIPLFISPSGDDSFRAPKLYLFRALCMTIVAVAVLIGRASHVLTTLMIPAAQLGIAIVIWAVVSAALSSDRTISFERVFDIACGYIFLLAVLDSGKGRARKGAALLLITAAINSIAYLLQTIPSVSEMVMHSREHMATTALLGNPNDVGMFLVVPALLAVAFAIRDRTHRLAFGTTGALILIALLTTQTLTAILAVSAGIFAILLEQQRERSVVFAVAAAAAITAALFIYAPSRHRIDHALRYAQEGEWNSVLSGRLSAYVPAWDMWVDHPIAGVGPGGFAHRFFDYRLRSITEHPRLVHWPAGLGIAPNFAETHSDHLQILAETGIVGYGLFIAALILIARRKASDATSALDCARRPIIIAVAVLAATGFPLQTAATAMPLLFFAGLSEAERAVQ
ncbi:MAG TPA: O-antigen ligase family protein [Vicinamibacterales bacterium]|nr:O-antigen ligase family protein [Vicinamibacterales bacterium]